jgi:protocatechuate 3,4-dioxygenase alpha subunit
MDPVHPAGPLTPSQTLGPFFSHALPWPDGPYVVPAGAPGAFWLRGVVRDGAGDPVPDALIESWQADRGGSLTPTAGFRGFGRSPTDPEGRYAIHTVKPGAVPAPDGRPQAPHLDLSIFARGLLDRVVTRIYFVDETAANLVDPVLAGMAEPDRATLIARPAADGYTFDIRLQGDHETVFFSI